MTASSTGGSLITRKVGMFNIPQTINVNMLSISATTGTVAGTLKICIYDESGNKIIDRTANGTTTASTISTTTPSTVQLHPGNYYMAVGCATACTVTLNYWTTAGANPLTTSVPKGKKAYEGVANMTSGLCDATMPAITPVLASTPVGRLDN